MFTSLQPHQESHAVDLGMSMGHRSEKILYIGDSTFFRHTFLEYFTNSALAVDIVQAKIVLEKATIFPDLIVMDIANNHLQLVAFKVWLRTHNLHQIPVIYNDAALATHEIKLLFSQKLVDDVLNLDKHYTDLPYKLRFLQKLKSSLASQPTNISRKLSNTTGIFNIGNKVLDILVSSAAITCCLPLFLLIALAIKIESKGPILYFSKRAGKGFRVFNFFKFRTMIVGADLKMQEFTDLNQYTTGSKQPLFFKLQNDPRVTKVGAFLRKTSLDELPQLFNVLKGDMSVVGNRPLPLYEASTLTTNEWAERFMAPAGITGLWQISKRGKDDMSNEERILIDIDYARTRSLAGDLKILFKTPAAMIQKSNV